MSKGLWATLAIGVGAAVSVAIASQSKTIRKALERKKDKKEEEGEELKSQPSRSPFYCQLSNELMTDPVITPYKTTFERRNIEEWIQTHGTCPVTKKPLRIEDLQASRSLKLAIEQYREASAK